MKKREYDLIGSQPQGILSGNALTVLIVLGLWGAGLFGSAPSFGAGSDNQASPHHPVPVVISIAEEGRVAPDGSISGQISLCSSPPGKQADPGAALELGYFRETPQGRSLSILLCQDARPESNVGEEGLWSGEFSLDSSRENREFTLFAAASGSPDTVFFPLRAVTVPSDSGIPKIYFVPQQQVTPAALSENSSDRALTWSMALIRKNLAQLKPDYRSPQSLRLSINRFTQKYAQFTPEQVHSLIKETIALAPQHFSFADQARVQSLIEVESRRNPLAISSHGAVGLAQLMGSVARREDFGGLQTVDSRQALHDLYRKRITVEQFFDLLLRDERSDPRKNIFSALSYLGHLFRQFGGSQLKALAAYHCGDATVKRALRKNGELNLRGIPPSTRYEFLPRVLKDRHEQ